MIDLIIGLCGSVVLLSICYGLSEYETRYYNNKEKKNV